MNVVAISGRLGGDPILRTTTTGVPVASFTLANAKNKTETYWFDCVAWRNNAEFVAQYLKKGMNVGVQGELQTRNYETKDGQKRKVTEIVVTNVTIFDRKETEPPVEVKEEDLPF